LRLAGVEREISILMEDPYDGIYISIYKLCEDAILSAEICDTNGR
jgi:hypothetical protein